MAREYRVVGWPRDCTDMLGSHVLILDGDSRLKHTRRDQVKLLQKGSNSYTVASPPVEEPLSQVLGPVGSSSLASLSSSMVAYSPATACRGGRRSQPRVLLARWSPRKAATGRRGSVPGARRPGRVGRSAYDHARRPGAFRQW